MAKRTRTSRVAPRKVALFLKSFGAVRGSVFGAVRGSVFGAVRGSVVDHNHRGLGDGKRQLLKLLDEKSTVHTPLCGHKMALIAATQQGKTVQAFSLASRHEHFFISKLPCIRHTRLHRHPAFISIILSIIQRDQSLLTKPLQLPQTFDFVRVKLRLALATGTFSDAFKATTVFFTKRRSVRSQKLLPRACSSSALATLMR